MASGDVPISDEQETMLIEAFRFVADHRYYLRTAISDRDPERAIKHAVVLANELRSAQLVPERYYKLYVVVFWELQHLAGYLANAAAKREVDLTELYAYVQHEGNLLPRLYLLVTVGAVNVHVQSHRGAPVEELEEIVSDMAALLSAAQHPVRGLFLRYYYLQVMKDKLPLLGIQKALKLLLLNLRQSIRLWSRLRLLDLEGGAQQAPAASAEAAAAAEDGLDLDRTRHTLRLVVSAHLAHMARLQGLTIELYRESLLPEVLQTSSTGCEDPAGQAFLLSSFVEAFPVEFHLQTIELVLQACAHIHWAVDLCPLLEHLLRRLCAFVVEHRGSSKAANFDPFSAFHAHLGLLLARPPSAATPLVSLLHLHFELLVAGMALHPGDCSCVQLVLASVVELLRQRGGSDAGLDEACVRALMDLLATPLAKDTLLEGVLAMPHHTALVQGLDYNGQRRCALAMVSAILAGDVSIGSVDTLRHLFALIDPLLYDESVRDDSHILLRDSSRQQKHLEHDPVLFGSDQELMARLVHQFRHPDQRVAFDMLVALRSYFDDGGPHRIVFTLPATAVSALSLARPLAAAAAAAEEAAGAGPSLAELFGFVYDTILGLGSLCPEHSLRLWLLGAATIGGVVRQGCGDAAGGLPDTCNRFVEAALRCLEGGISGCKERLLGLQLVAGTLCEATCLGEDRFKTAAGRAVDVARDLISKQLQSQGFSVCAALYWSPACKDADLAVACVQRALHSADGAIHIDPTHVGLFVEALDRAALLFNDANPEITSAFLSCLAALCAQHLHYLEDRVPQEAVRSLSATVDDLKRKQQEAAVALMGMTRPGTAADATQAAEATPEVVQPAAGAGAGQSPALTETARYAALTLDDAIFPEGAVAVA